MDSQQLADMFAAIEKQHIRLHSLLIVRNGYVVVEAYYPPYTAETRHTVQSITKSVIGTLIRSFAAEGSRERRLTDTTAASSIPVAVRLL